MATTWPAWVDPVRVGVCPRSMDLLALSQEADMQPRLIVATGASMIRAAGTQLVVAHDDARVLALEDARVLADDDVLVVACDRVSVHARGRARVVLLDDASCEIAGAATCYRV